MNLFLEITELRILQIQIVNFVYKELHLYCRVKLGPEIQHGTRLRARIRLG